MGWGEGFVSNREEEREERGEIRDERKEKREERRKWIPRATWTPCQHLMVNLTLFDHFNGLSYEKG